ncbi:hypothetical protein BCT01_08540 [Vibrio tasmaniensis]|uniref:DNA cytosine methyltransferase n=1 Tax=Vibrio TaxID=662 RepID=UPI000C83B868|nr:DNA cytosine methyltransferase [Vibrio tasmaniensis]PMO80329.1 hypothetical protein BCT01_08540 [Vibrio tasmaniensis]
MSAITMSATAPAGVFTKQLTITRYSCGKRKVQLSTNILALMGFKKGSKVVEQNLGDGLGYVVKLSEKLPLLSKVKRIYSRTYKSGRKNNPFELTFETSSKAILNSIPEATDKVHVSISYGEFRVVPIVNQLAERLMQVLTSKKPLSCFSACTAGIDCHAAASEGFKIDHVLEYRPRNASDKNADFSESGILSAISNVEVGNVFNEDITHVSIDMLKKYYDEKPSSLFTISLECSEFSRLKSASEREASFQSGNSSLSMVYDGLRIIDGLKFPVVLMEQVPGFKDSDLYKLWDLRLRQMGYKTKTAVLDAREYGGVSSRARLFHFSTLLPTKFEFPKPTPRTTTTVWDQLVAKYIREPVTKIIRNKPVTMYGQLRDVTDTSSVKKGIETGRIRTISESSLHAPSLTRSQRKQTKDAIYIEYQGRYLMPSLELEAEIMGVPEEFDLNMNSINLASAILGQAVDWPLYKSIISQVKKHLLQFIYGKGEAMVW